MMLAEIDSLIQKMHSLTKTNHFDHANLRSTLIDGNKKKINFFQKQEQNSDYEFKCKESLER